MVQVISAQYQNYNGHWYRAGETMEVTEADASDMVAMNLASRVKKPVVQNREMVPDDTRERTIEVVKPTTPKKDKKYPHREMRSRQ